MYVYAKRHRFLVLSLYTLPLFAVININNKGQIRGCGGYDWAKLYKRQQTDDRKGVGNDQ
jgi:hypothetical protein